MNLNRRQINFGIIVSIGLIILVVLIYMVVSLTNTNDHKINLYLINNNSYTLVKESENLKGELTPERILESYTSYNGSGNLENLLDKNIKVLSWSKNGNTLKVNLNKDFLSGSNGYKSDVLTISGFTNTLIEAFGVKYVDFKVDGVNENLYKGAVDISQPLEKNYENVLK